MYAQVLRGTSLVASLHITNKVQLSIHRNTVARGPTYGSDTSLTMFRNHLAEMAREELTCWSFDKMGCFSHIREIPEVWNWKRS